MSCLFKMFALLMKKLICFEGISKIWTLKVTWPFIESKICSVLLVFWFDHFTISNMNTWQWDLLLEYICSVDYLLFINFHKLIFLLRIIFKKVKIIFKYYSATTNLFITQWNTVKNYSFLRLFLSISLSFHLFISLFCVYTCVKYIRLYCFRDRLNSEVSIWKKSLTYISYWQTEMI